VFSQAKGDKGPPEWSSTHPNDKTRIAGLNIYFSRAKFKYHNVKLQHGLGETFNLPAEKTDNNEPKKPNPVPGVSVETLLP
jgi:predicted Zn-dependent protease